MENNHYGSKSYSIRFIFCSCIQLHVLLSNKDLSIFMFVMIKLRRRFKFRWVELGVPKSVRVMTADGIWTWYCWWEVRLLVAHVEWKQPRRRCEIPVNGVGWTAVWIYLQELTGTAGQSAPFRSFCLLPVDSGTVFFISFYSCFEWSSTLVTYPNLYLCLGQLQVLG